MKISKIFLSPHFLLPMILKNFSSPRISLSSKIQLQTFTKWEWGVGEPLCINEDIFSCKPIGFVSLFYPYKNQCKNTWSVLLGVEQGNNDLKWESFNQYVKLNISHFLPSDIHTYMSVLESKCLIFGKICVRTKWIIPWVN